MHDAEYRDILPPPRHGYVAFYLWLRSQVVDALVHMGCMARWNGRRARPSCCPASAGPRR
nr:cobaltochelatase subunit CobN [Rhodovulum imhoffii]